jgi:hypothetical protein
MLRGIELAFLLPFAASWFATGSTVSWGKRLKRRGACRVTNHAGSLEGKENLLRLQQDIPLTEAEANAGKDGVHSFEKLLAQLSDVPTPAGPTPRQLQSGLVQIEPTTDKRK